ncbi:hypothetical protein R1flu_012653 [Riccia fluitans]|uniref:Dipeptide epimerase n=1 Tax=Riccia fluitans TaxID=41844 RepID=A0ABD1ZB91_9MARC
MGPEAEELSRPSMTLLTGKTGTLSFCKLDQTSDHVVCHQALLCRQDAGKSLNFKPGTRNMRESTSEKNFMSALSSWDDSLDSYIVDVVEAEAAELNVPLLAPFTIATTKLDFVQNVAVRVELKDGSIGWGEASTLPPVTAEDQPTALKKAKEACHFLKTSKDVSLRKFLERVSELCPGHEFSSVRAGVQMAVVDAVARSLQLPLWKYFGGEKNSITTDITIPICSPEKAEELARSYFGRGFSTIKTKVGGRAVSLDIALLKAIRRGHPSCSLILDANCGYDAQSALEVLQKLHEEGLTPSLFEQPVKRDDWDGLGYVSKIARDVYGVPVAADESCRNVDDAKLIIQRRLADVVNVKLVKMGLLEAMEIIALVKEAGLGLMIGGMVETRLAMGFSAHMVAGLGGFRYVDLDTPLLLAEDPIQGGYEVAGAEYLLTSEFGSGSSLKESVGSCFT